MSKLYEILNDAKKVDAAIAAKHVILPLSKILGVVRDQDGELLVEKQDLLTVNPYFVKFIREEKSVNYTKDSITYTFKCDVKEKDLPHEAKIHVRCVEETNFGEKNLGTVIDSDFIFADSNLEYYIDFTDQVVYAVDNEDVETESEVLDDVNVLIEVPRTVAYHTEYPTEEDDWSGALGIEKPEKPIPDPVPEPQPEPKPEEPKPEEPAPQDPKPEDPKPEPKPQPEEDKKPEDKKDCKKSSKKFKIAGIVLAVVVLVAIVGLTIYNQ
jgi:AAA ATPase|nr:MAG TPA: hypothetical protein [Caudoviricetes sp.]